MRISDWSSDVCSSVLVSAGGKAVGIACDIKSAESVEAMLDRIWADGGPLTGLVNNAAGNFLARTEDISMRAFDAIADIDRKSKSLNPVTNAHLVCRLLLEKKKKNLLKI